MLTVDEQTMLRRLSVFHDGFDLARREVAVMFDQELAHWLE